MFTVRVIEKKTNKVMAITTFDTVEDLLMVFGERKVDKLDKGYRLEHGNGKPFDIKTIYLHR